MGTKHILCTFISRSLCKVRFILCHGNPHQQNHRCWACSGEQLYLFLMIIGLTFNPNFNIYLTSFTTTVYTFYRAANVVAVHIWRSKVWWMQWRNWKIVIYWWLFLSLTVTRRFRNGCARQWQKTYIPEWYITMIPGTFVKVCYGPQLYKWIYHENKIEVLNKMKSVWVEMVTYLNVN